MLVCSLCCMYSAAQDTLPKGKRLNIYLSYNIGLQTFKLGWLENLTRGRLERNMPTAGEVENINFPATVINQLSIGGSIFKNKKWFLHLDAVWGKNNIISQAYSTDTFGNRYVITANSDFKVLYTGYFIRREIPLGKRGTVAPFIAFYMHWGAPARVYINYRVYDAATNEQIQSSKGFGGSGEPYRYGSPYILWLFDNPKLGLNYNIKLFNHTYLNLNYSYWWANAYANELYSLSGYIFKPKNGRRTTKDHTFHKDLYSHNISVGLTFKLLK